MKYLCPRDFRRGEMEEKMKVLVIGPSPEKSKGGMATVISEIKSDKDLVTEYNIDIYESYIDGNIVIRTIYCIYAYLKFYFTKRDYDIYHIHAASRGSTFRKGYYVRAAKKWGKKVIFHIHGAQYMEFYRELLKRKKKTVLDILHRADIVIALSDEWKERFDSIFKLDNCVVLENGIDTNKYKQAIVDVKSYQHSFLMLGRLGKRKGTYDLIDAIQLAKKTVPNIKLYLAGDGDIERIKEIIKNKKLENNIEVVGWVNLNDKLKLLKLVSTVVLPSYNEGLPMAILEGMVAGKGIISTTVGAIPEVISDKNGILIKPGDIKALAQALTTYAQDIDFLCSTSAENIIRVNERFSMKAMHNKLADYYNTVAKM